MENSENVDIPIRLEQIGNSIMPIKEDPHVPGRCPITLTDLRKRNEVLGPIVDALNGTCGSLWIIGCDILEDVFEPALSFLGPRYFRHDRMRRAISSFEITRFASESAKPRSTIT